MIRLLLILLKNTVVLRLNDVNKYLMNKDNKLNIKILNFTKFFSSSKDKLNSDTLKLLQELNNSISEKIGGFKQ